MSENPVHGSIGMIIARTASTTENPVHALHLALEILSHGKQVGLFLIGDGVYLAKNGKTESAVLLARLISKGAKVYASPEHLKASGFTKERLVPGIVIVEDTYADLVDFVMERYEKVIPC